jgi:hypothetical protein
MWLWSYGAPCPGGFSLALHAFESARWIRALPDNRGSFQDNQDNHDAYKDEYNAPGQHYEIPRKLHTG